MKGRKVMERNNKVTRGDGVPDSLAFTLAEVLITLAIIGVVAALTVPTVVRNYQKQQTVVKLKKAYTQLHQAIGLSEIDNGATNTWDYTLDSKTFYDKYLKGYLKVSKVLGSVSTDALGIEYKFLDGTKATEWTFVGSGGYKLILNDGTLISFGAGVEHGRKIIYFDINGFKKPNTCGKDLFGFAIVPKYKIVPFGFNLPTSSGSFGETLDRNKIITSTSSFACNKNGKHALWCAALIMADNWTISDDYPWQSGS